MNRAEAARQAEARPSHPERGAKEEKASEGNEQARGESCTAFAPSFDLAAAKLSPVAESGGIKSATAELGALGEPRPLPPCWADGSSVGS